MFKITVLYKSDKKIIIFFFTMIEVSRISKRFGHRLVLEDVSFYVEKGEILGFLGPNGAGKTTTMRILTGFLPPNSGTVRIGGYDIQKEPLKVKRLLGYLPEHNPLYTEMTVRDYLFFVAETKGVERPNRKTQVNETIQRCGLREVASRLIGHLSKGYRQRIGMAQALIGDPEVLILDEPTIGLDPKQILEIRQLIKELAGKKTIILSTHILPEVSMTCTRALIINKGRVVAEDALDNLTYTRGVSISVRANPQSLLSTLNSIDGVKRVAIEDEKEGIVRASIETGQEVRAKIAYKIIQNGWELFEMTPLRASLEESFVRLVTEEEGQ